MHYFSKISKKRELWECQNRVSFKIEAFQNNYTKLNWEKPNYIYTYNSKFFVFANMYVFFKFYLMCHNYFKTCKHLTLKTFHEQMKI